MIDKKTKEFLYWHAVSKVNNARFREAQHLFSLLALIQPDFVPSVLGLIYCKLRLQDISNVKEDFKVLFSLPLNVIEERLANRLHKRFSIEG